MATTHPDNVEKIHIPKSPIDMLGEVQIDFMALAAIIQMAVEHMENMNISTDQTSPTYEAERELTCLLYSIERRAIPMRKYFSRALAQIAAGIEVENAKRSAGAAVQ